MFAVSVPPIQLIMPIGICDAVHNLWQQDTESSALTSDGWSPRCRGPRNAHGSSSRSPPNFYHRVIATEIGRRQLEEIRITSQLTNPHQRQAVATTHLHHVKQCNVRVVMRLSQHVAFDRNKKRWATDDSSKHKFNIRPVQFRPHWTNPKLGGKQIWIPHAHKSERWLGRYVVSWKMCGVVLVLVGRSLVRALSQASMPWTGKVWKMMICQKISSASRAAGHMFASSQQPHHNHFSDQISLWNTFVRYLSINTKAKKRYLRICRLGRIHPQDSWLNNDSGKDKNLICTNKILICLYFTSNHSGKQPAYCQQEYMDKQPSFVTQNNSRNLDSKDGAVVQSGYHRYAECGRGGVNWGVVHNSVLLSAPEQFYPHSINCPPYSCPQLCAAVRLFRHQHLRHHPPQHLCYRIMCLFLHQYGHLAEQSCWKNCMWWSLSCYIVGSTTGEIPAILACTSGSSYKVLALSRC